FGVLPSDGGAWVGQVEDERKDASIVVRSDPPVVLLDRSGIHVERHGRGPARRGQPAEQSRVGPEVPDDARPYLVQERRDKLLLVLQRRAAVALGLGVIPRPR